MPDALISSTTSPGPGTGSGKSMISSLRLPGNTTPFMDPPLLFELTLAGVRRTRFCVLNASSRLLVHGPVERDRCIGAAKALDGRFQLRLDVILVVAVENRAEQPAVEVAGAHHLIRDRKCEVHV